jgi:hypothetical protein
VNYRCLKGHEFETVTIRGLFWGFCTKCKNRRKLTVSPEALSLVLRVIPAVAQVTGGSIDVPLAAFKVVIKALGAGALVIDTQPIPSIRILQERVRTHFVVRAVEPTMHRAPAAAARAMPRDPAPAAEVPRAASTPSTTTRPTVPTMSAEAQAKRLRDWEEWTGADLGEGSLKAPFTECLSD